MLPSGRFCLCVALGVAPSASCANDAEPAPPYELEVPVTHTLLDNGLELLVVPNHTAPSVTALVAFRAGSSVEDEALNGYSHLFEHMMFQGSREVPDSREFRDRLQALGARSNATTSKDSVTYYFTVPSSALDAALGLFAGALREPALDEARLDKERGVVLAEVDLNESSPTFASYRAGLQALFGDYAVRLDPLGSRDVVSSVTRSDLLAMHDVYYVPNNALLVLSGDIAAADAEELAERHFGEWPSAPDPFAAAPPMPVALRESAYRVVTAEVTNTLIEVWWQGPSVSADPEGVLAGDVLCDVTDQTNHSFRGLQSFDLALSASLGQQALRHAGLIKANLTVPPGKERDVLSALKRVVAGIGEPGDITQAQLVTAQREGFNQRLRELTSPTQLAGALGSEFGRGDAHGYFDYPDALYRVDRGALQRFARDYLRKPKVIVLTSSAANLAAQGIDEAWLREEDQR